MWCLRGKGGFEVQVVSWFEVIRIESVVLHLERDYDIVQARGVSDAVVVPVVRFVFVIVGVTVSEITCMNVIMGRAVSVIVTINAIRSLTVSVVMAMVKTMIAGV